MGQLEILLVENDSYWQNILEEKIAEALQNIPGAVRPRLVTRAPEAHTALLQEGPWDLIITDIGLDSPQNLPGRQLVEVANKLHVPCIVVTGVATSAVQVKTFFKRQNVYNYFGKDSFDSKEFIDDIKKIAEQATKGERKLKESKHLITWLHLSDLHLKETTSYNAKVVLDALLADIERQKQDEELEPDFVVVSGDIVFSGNPNEYEQAKSFFDTLLTKVNLHKDRLFIVPGNHDVDRHTITLISAGAADMLNTRDAVNVVLESDVDRNLLLRRLENYNVFIREYLGDGSLESDSLYTIGKINLAELEVCILGLNSAWISSGDNDRNRLLLGERQVRDALVDAEKADLKIAVMHHPFEWLQDFDQGDTVPLLLNTCDFILHGHLHKTGLICKSSPDGSAFIFAAGACYERRSYPNAYNFVRVDLDERFGTAYLRTYSDKEGGFWTNDTMTYQNAPEGKFSFSIKDRTT